MTAPRTPAALAAQETRLDRRLRELRKTADAVRAFDRLDAKLLADIVLFATLRLQGIPTANAKRDTVRDMKRVIDILAYCASPQAWWHSVDDDADRSQWSKPRPRAMKAEAMRVEGAAIIRSILEGPEGEP